MQKNKAPGCHSEQQIGMDGPNCSTNINSDENYCGVCSGYYYTNKSGEQCVKYIGNWMMIP
jgi:hypothetical protein